MQRQRLGRMDVVRGSRSEAEAAVRAFVHLLIQMSLVRGAVRRMEKDVGDDEV